MNEAPEKIWLYRSIISNEWKSIIYGQSNANDIEYIRADLYQNGKESAKQYKEAYTDAMKDNKRLRASLEAVGWVAVPPGYNDFWVCAWCNNYDSHGHKLNCHRQTALGEEVEDDRLHHKTNIC